MFRRATATSVGALLGVLLPLCSCDTPPPPDDGVGAIQFDDIPVPDGMKLQEHNHKSDSAVIGEFRYANFVYTGTVPVAEVSAYLRDRMPQHRWHLTRDEVKPSGEEYLRFRRGKYVADCSLAQDEEIKATTHMKVAVRTSREPTNGK